MNGIRDHSNVLICRVAQGKKRRHRLKNMCACVWHAPVSLCAHALHTHTPNTPTSCGSVQVQVSTYV